MLTFSTVSHVSRSFPSERDVQFERADSVTGLRETYVIVTAAVDREKAAMIRISNDSENQRICRTSGFHNSDYRNYVFRNIVLGIKIKYKRRFG
jgi:hypothetical protein